MEDEDCEDTELVELLLSVDVLLELWDETLLVELLLRLLTLDVLDEEREETELVEELETELVEELLRLDVLLLLLLDSSSATPACKSSWSVPFCNKTKSPFCKRT